MSKCADQSIRVQAYVQCQLKEHVNKKDWYSFDPSLVSLNCYNVQMSLQAFFLSTIGQAFSRKRDFKCEQKARTSTSELQRALHLASLALYKINREVLAEFISDRGNQFLIEYFARNDGMKKTDSDPKKPDCRQRELISILTAIAQLNRNLP